MKRMKDAEIKEREEATTSTAVTNSSNSIFSFGNLLAAPFDSSASLVAGAMKTMTRAGRDPPPSLNSGTNVGDSTTSTPPNNNNNSSSSSNTIHQILQASKTLPGIVGITPSEDARMNEYCERLLLAQTSTCSGVKSAPTGLSSGAGGGGSNTYLFPECEDNMLTSKNTTATATAKSVDWDNLQILSVNEHCLSTRTMMQSVCSSMSFHVDGCSSATAALRHPKVLSGSDNDTDNDNTADVKEQRNDDAVEDCGFAKIDEHRDMYLEPCEDWNANCGLDNDYLDVTKDDPSSAAAAAAAVPNTLLLMPKDSLLPSLHQVAIVLTTPQPAPGENNLITELLLKNDSGTILSKPNTGEQTSDISDSIGVIEEEKSSIINVSLCGDREPDNQRMSGQASTASSQQSRPLQPVEIHIEDGEIDVEWAKGSLSRNSSRRSIASSSFSSSFGQGEREANLLDQDQGMSTDEYSSSFTDGFNAMVRSSTTCTSPTTTIRSRYEEDRRPRYQRESDVRSSSSTDGTDAMKISSATTATTASRNKSEEDHQPGCQWESGVNSSSSTDDTNAMDRSPITGSRDVYSSSVTDGTDAMDRSSTAASQTSYEEDEQSNYLPFFTKDLLYPSSISTSEDGSVSGSSRSVSSRSETGSAATIISVSDTDDHSDRKRLEEAKSSFLNLRSSASGSPLSSQHRLLHRKPISLPTERLLPSRSDDREESIEVIHESESAHTEQRKACSFALLPQWRKGDAKIGTMLPRMLEPEGDLQGTGSFRCQSVSGVDSVHRDATSPPISNTGQRIIQIESDEVTFESCSSSSSCYPVSNSQLNSTLSPISSQEHEHGEEHHSDSVLASRLLRDAQRITKEKTTDKVNSGRVEQGAKQSLGDKEEQGEKNQSASGDARRRCKEGRRCKEETPDTVNSGKIEQGAEQCLGDRESQALTLNRICRETEPSMRARENKPENGLRCSIHNFNSDGRKVTESEQPVVNNRIIFSTSSAKMLITNNEHSPSTDSQAPDVSVGSMPNEEMIAYDSSESDIMGAGPSSSSSYESMIDSKILIEDLNHERSPTPSASKSHHFPSEATTPRNMEDPYSMSRFAPVELKIEKKEPALISALIRKVGSYDAKIIAHKTKLQLIRTAVSLDRYYHKDVQGEQSLQNGDKVSSPPAKKPRIHRKMSPSEMSLVTMFSSSSSSSASSRDDHCSQTSHHSSELERDRYSSVERDQTANQAVAEFSSRSKNLSAQENRDPSCSDGPSKTRDSNCSEFPERLLQNERGTGKESLSPTPDNHPNNIIAVTEVDTESSKESRDENSSVSEKAQDIQVLAEIQVSSSRSDDNQLKTSCQSDRRWAARAMWGNDKQHVEIHISPDEIDVELGVAFDSCPPTAKDSSSADDVSRQSRAQKASNPPGLALSNDSEESSVSASDSLGDDSTALVIIAQSESASGTLDNEFTAADDMPRRSRARTASNPPGLALSDDSEESSVSASGNLGGDSTAILAQSEKASETLDHDSAALRIAQLETRINDEQGEVQSWEAPTSTLTSMHSPPKSHDSHLLEQLLAIRSMAAQLLPIDSTLREPLLPQIGGADAEYNDIIDLEEGRTTSTQSPRNTRDSNLLQRLLALQSLALQRLPLDSTLHEPLLPQIGGSPRLDEEIPGTSSEDKAREGIDHSADVEHNDSAALEEGQTVADRAIVTVQLSNYWRRLIEICYNSQVTVPEMLLGMTLMVSTLFFLCLISGLV